MGIVTAKRSSLYSNVQRRTLSCDIAQRTCSTAHVVFRPLVNKPHLVIHNSCQTSMISAIHWGPMFLPLPPLFRFQYSRRKITSGPIPPSAGLSTSSCLGMIKYLLQLAMYHITLRCQFFGQLDLMVIQKVRVRYDNEGHVDAKGIKY